MSYLAHHHALLAAATAVRYGLEDFSTYPAVTYPDAPLGSPRWEESAIRGGSVTSGVLTVRAKHNDTPGLRYTSQANTAGKYTRVLLDYYAGIADEERRILFEVNSILGQNLAAGMFYFGADSAQVALFGFSANSSVTSVYELTGRPNAALAVSTTEPTWLELYVPGPLIPGDDPDAERNKLQARTWGMSKPRPAVAGYSKKMTDLIAQYGPISQAGQLVLRSINNDAARVRKIAILSTP